MPATLVAKRTKVTLPNTRRTLEMLWQLGVVERLGDSRNVVYRLALEHTLVQALIAMFDVEASRRKYLYGRIHTAIDIMRPPPVAVWLFGSAARGDDTNRSDLDLALVTDAAHVEVQTAALRNALIPLETELGVTPSVMGTTVPRLRALAKERNVLWRSLRLDAIALHGPTPDELLRRQ
jgi:predicted nucleotidyltransferase